MGIVEYDDELDLLEIRRENEKVSKSMEVGENLIIHVNSAFKVVSLEIVGASKFLNVTKNQLKEIKSASIGTIMHNDNYGVAYSIFLPKEKIESSVYMHPTPVQVATR